MWDMNNDEFNVGRAIANITAIGVIGIILYYLLIIAAGVFIIYLGYDVIIYIVDAIKELARDRHSEEITMISNILLPLMG